MSEIGKLTALGTPTLEGPEEPQRMMVSPDGKNLYVCGAKKGGTNAGLWVYTRNTSTGALTFLEKFTTELNGCYDVWVTEFESKSFVYVCNRTNPAAKAVAFFKREPATGKLTKEGFVECAGIVENAAEGAAGGGCHSIEGTADHKFLYVCTQSEPAKVFQFKINQTTGKPEALSPASLEVSGKLMFGLRMTPETGNKYLYGVLLKTLFSQAPGEVVVFTRNESTGLLTQLERTSTGTGLLTALSPATASTTGSEPVGVVISADGKHVYIGSESTNKIFMFSKSATTGLLTAIGTGFVETTGTEGNEEPRTLALSADGKTLYAACFSSKATKKARVVVYERNATTGELTKLEETLGTLEAEGLHGIEVTPDGKNVYSADYGNKKIFQWERNTGTGKLTALGTAFIATGVNPNGIAMAVIGGTTYVYTADRNEASSANSTIHCYKREGTGQLAALAGTPTVEAGQNPHALVCSGDGKYLYCVNAAEKTAGAKTISQYKINQGTGVLEALSPATVEYTSAAGAGAAKTGGRGLAISADGLSLYMTCGQGNVVQLFFRDISTGLLTASVNTAAGARGYGVAIDPNEKYVYVANEGSGSVSQFSRAQVECAGECVVSPDGKNLYVSNKEPVSGLPTETVGGKTGVEVNPNGVSAFSINAGTGKVTLLTEPFSKTVEEPRGIHIDGEGKTVYVCCQGRQFIYAFDREAATGKLTFKEAVDTGAETREPSHGCLSPDGKSFYNSDKNLKTEEATTVGKLISQWSRVTELAGAPTITNPGNQTSELAKATSLQIAATNATSYSAKGLPPGLTVNTATGKIEGTPTKWGTSEPTITATGTGGSASATFQWYIKVAVASAAVVWKADAEKTNWFEEWGCIQAFAEARVSKDTILKAQGTASYKIEVQTTDGENTSLRPFGERAEVQWQVQSSAFLGGHASLNTKENEEDKQATPIFKEGDDVWLAFQVYLDESFAVNWPSWQVISQVHPIEPETTPPWTISVEKEKWRLNTDASSEERSASNERIPRWEAPAVRQRWVKFLLHVKCSQDPTVGFLELWADLGDGEGFKQRLIAGLNQYKVWTLKKNEEAAYDVGKPHFGWKTLPAAFQHCIYRDPSTTNVKNGAATNERHNSSIHFDGTTLAETRAAAEAGAFGSSPAPTVTKPADQVSTVSLAAGALQIQASNATSYAATSLPTGLTINTATGLISGTPTKTEVATVTVTVTGPGGTAETSFKWTIAGSVPALGLSKAPPGLPSLHEFNPPSASSVQEIAERLNEVIAALRGVGITQ